MAATIVGGVGGYGWQASDKDKDGHRDYTLSTLVVTSYLDGPATVMATPGLPAVGSVWSIGNDLDSWAFCWPEMRVTPVGRIKQDRNEFWRVNQKFSTRPLSRCQDTAIENPLMEPQKVSGSFLRFVKTIHKDRNGDPLMTTSHEPLTGPDVEFNDSRPTVHIEQNTPALELETLADMRDTVNDRELWGLPERCVLLSSIAWERLLYGICTFYYKRVFDFEIDSGTFDRETPNYGTMCRRGEWDHESASPTYEQWIPDTTLDSDDPNNFMRFEDFYGQVRRVLLDDEGDPITNASGTGTGTGTGTNNGVRYIDIEHYEESNLLLLGIPVVLAP